LSDGFNTAGIENSLMNSHNSQMLSHTLRQSFNSRICFISFE